MNAFLVVFILDWLMKPIIEVQKRLVMSLMVIADSISLGSAILHMMAAFRQCVVYEGGGGGD